MTVNVALTIAGSDSGGGAGIQADLKTFQELGVFGTSVLTAVTAQNTHGVHGVYPVPTDGVTAQIRAVLDDFDVKACKTGMLFSAEIIIAVAAVLKEYPPFPLIIDPVMIAKGGHSLLQQEAIQAMKDHLIPMAAIITPNIPEAEVFTKMKIVSDEDIQHAAQKIISMGAHAVILKGGHRCDVLEAKDYYLDCEGQSFTMTTPWVQTKDTHGTGCTFAAALAGFIAKGYSMTDAVAEAKQFIQAAIEHGLRLGSGHGPTNHWAYGQLKKGMH
ncbi:MULTISPECIES: bifunctional hydroxymethylpyrimidine kinase/phosphomethylpyrimidine kinase [unclassified Sporosarcina]|uniref:bifunctional hydroxymethylpyrimidine kinase/phosphomethylpyrimidine kinase n=1 Tax=unclassified Sporosarcina TaxID=2647733 RepID=UPI00203DB831|nr:MULTISPECIES: bifunctional hydroxymethylpyrimidine kinase/phosphomethylpyrimidine kinase [unclassified Sporosarcina]GKV66381.1 hydroxymethylpyrimidine/phosphomethylpyrimidine kinase [Sporosarcina sp. NCCP-2331]GLB56498.1 hydroxymethylpyrimidine/phosphomethylpyrimidine kinase [Sporosarcina sp. NCCP-2378]